MDKRSRDRVKKTGEVFTPEWLVDEMLRKLGNQDPTLFTNPDKTFLEPSCGDGNFLVRILHFKINGFRETNPDTDVPIERILRSIYAVDLLDTNVIAAIARMINFIRTELGITNEHRVRNLQKILGGRDGKPGQIVRANGLEWDFDNWRPKNGKPYQPIYWKTKAERQNAVDTILASLGSKSKLTKKPNLIPTYQIPIQLELPLFA